MHRPPAARRTCLSRSVALAHIFRNDEGLATGVWGLYTLRSAFQPIFGFHGGKLTVDAFEGLIRPLQNGEEVTPMTFFATIPAVDRLHVETITRTLHLFNAGRFLDPAMMLFVNFDPSVFGERAVAEATLGEMRLTLHETGIDPRRIVCEVTEQKSTSPAALASFVSALRDNGFKIAVDDYGSEESDLERVSALKPDIVKFDARWIGRLMETRPGFALLSVMVKEFASRGIKVVFEGIEEHWQVEQAEEAGAHMVQGYALARPDLAPDIFATFGRAMAEPASGAEPATRPPPLRPGAVAPASRASRHISRPFGRRSSS